MKEQQKYVKPLVETVVMKSSVLERTVYYDVVEPEPSIDTRGPRGILYLLHGLFGDRTNWTTSTRILEYAADKEFLIVCPDAGDNWYIDRPENEGPSYEKYILDEILPDAERRFAAGGDRARRAIAGISMGGYGAFKMAVRRPGHFCFAGSMSGAFHAASIGADEPRAEVISSVAETFATDEIRRSNDLFSLLRGSAARGLDGRHAMFYFDCGRDDEFVSANRHLDQLLSDLDIEHEYRELSGAHDWNYWDENLRGIIDRAGTELGV